MGSAIGGNRDVAQLGPDRRAPTKEVARATNSPAPPNREWVTTPGNGSMTDPDRQTGGLAFSRSPLRSIMRMGSSSQLFWWPRRARKRFAVWEMGLTPG
jgi:hypothetical protein